MAQGKTGNPFVQNLFEKQRIISLRPWQLRTVVAPFGIHNMKINCARVKPDEQVIISFKAINTADFTSIYPINLKINYEVVAAEVVSLPQKSIMPMKFTITKTMPGNYRVDVNNSIETFTVIGNPLENEIARIEGFHTDVSDMEASLDFISPQPEKPVEQREISIINAKSHPGKQTEMKVIRKEPSGRNVVQTGIDKVAEFIEKGLDKTGDIITFPIYKLVTIANSIQKELKKK